MSATNGGDKINRNGDKSGGFYANNGPADAVRSKIAALLDDVTVADSTPIAADTQVAASAPVTTDKPGANVNPPSAGTLAPQTEPSTPIGEKMPFALRDNGTSNFGAAPPPPLITPPASGITASPSQWHAPSQNATSLNPPSMNPLPQHPPPQNALPSYGDNTRNPKASQAISIKGRTDGVAIEIGKGHWPELLSELTERLTEASDFFRGGRVALDVGARPLLENELDQVPELLQKVGLKLGVVRTKSQRTFQAALNLGMATRLEPGGDAESADAQTAASNREAEQYFVYRGNLRSGQILQKHEHILVLGDVNPGAEVISAGDIFVWGRLRGIAHAGADGDVQAVIIAFEMNPVQLQIVDITGSAPEEPTTFTGRLLKKRRVVNRPKIAYLNGNQLVIELWDESRPGGIAAFRR